MYDEHSMPFPLTIADTALATPADLMRRVLESFSEEGHTNASEWLIALHPNHLDTSELTALTAALATRPEANALCTAAHLTLHLNDARLGALLLQACLGIDLGTLLTPASTTGDASIEDVLLQAIVQTAQLDDAALRTRLLERLRGAGHSQLEVEILADHGTSVEILEALPGILAEGTRLTTTQRDRLDKRSQDDSDSGARVQALLSNEA